MSAEAVASALRDGPAAARFDQPAARRHLGSRAVTAAQIGDDASLRGAVRDLRAGGEVVVADLGGSVGSGAEASPGRRLVEAGGRWTVAQR